MSIYEQHAAAFKNVSAYIVTRNGERVATISIKFPKDGAGRLYAYTHWLGVEMVRGMAGGYGYDKKSAALADAARKFMKRADAEESIRNHAINHLSGFLHALAKDDGLSWEANLRGAGFDILQAV